MNAQSPIHSRMGEIQNHAGEAAALLKALANDQRLVILCHLLAGPSSVGEINERVPLSQSALSQHLGVLRDAGLVTSARRSQSVLYALAPGPGIEIMEILDRGFCAPGAARARPRLRAAVTRAASAKGRKNCARSRR